MIIYNKLFAFEVHINDRFEITFDNEEEFQTWLTDFVYFIVPSDYIPAISRYKNVVREAYPKLAFNIVCEKYKINMWISLDKGFFLNVTEHNADQIIRYLFERYPY